MAEKSGFFNSFYGDRKYNAAFFAEYFSSFIGNGIYTGGTVLKVEPYGGNMDIKIKPGRAWINGYYYHLQDAPKVMTLQPANLTQGRIDRVVLRLNLEESYRHISVEVKTGQRADVPAAPELERTAAIWELGLADIRINPGVTEVLGSNVTDLRLDDTMCGLVTSVVEQADLASIFNQFQNYYNERKEQFDNWLADIDDIWQAYDAAYSLWYGQVQNRANTQYTDNQAVFDTQFSDNQDAFDDQFSNNQDAFDGQMVAQHTEYSGWFNQIKAELFNNIHFQFDNWALKTGYQYLTQFDVPQAGTITEQIINMDNGTILASRITKFHTPEPGSITVTLQVSEPQIHVRKITRFDTLAEGIVSEEVLEVTE